MIKKIVFFLLGLMLFIPTAGLAATSSKISIDTYYLVVSPNKDGSTNMMGMASYTNSSSQEYKGDGTSEAVLSITLPDGATGLNFLDNKISTKQTDNGFITTTPIPANQTQVLPFSYKMPKGQNINLKFDHSVQMFQVLVPEGMGSVTFKGGESAEQGTFNFDGQSYVGYTIEGLQANQAITFQYNKDKQPAKSSGTKSQAKNSSSTSSSVTRTAPAFHNPGHIRMWEQSPLHNFNPHIFLIVLLAVIISGISYYIYFRRKARLEETRLGADKEESAFQLLMSKQKAILDKIIELEESHGNGTMNEEEYNKKLAAYKEHLVQVKLGLRKFVE